MEIITQNQRRILVELGKNKLANEIYFTGGTLLAYEYLHYRYSVE